MHAYIEIPIRLLVLLPITTLNAPSLFRRRPMSSDYKSCVGGNNSILCRRYGETRVYKTLLEFKTSSDDTRVTRVRRAEMFSVSFFLRTAVGPRVHAARARARVIETHSEWRRWYAVVRLCRCATCSSKRMSGNAALFECLSGIGGIDNRRCWIQDYRSLSGQQGIIKNKHIRKTFLIVRRVKVFLC